MATIETLNLIDRFHTMHKAERIGHYGAETTKMRQQIATQRVFKCQCCGRMCNYFELEAWACDFDHCEDGCVCSECYEEQQGADL